MLETLCIHSRQWEQAGITYREGFLSTEADHTIRFRLAGHRGFLTIKTKTVGLSRTEFEFEIPSDRAKALLDRVCEHPQIEKIRYKIPQGEVIWEVDEFLAENQGLILAEVELQDEAQQVVLPDWVGAEVSGDRRYYNSYLVKNPFTTW
ncbi:CYTH domain-containing protein [Alkalinema sp. FACHB-956]|nr:CYTH domain-containing protein [Alkalinema sp. FACHB-956]